VIGCFAGKGGSECCIYPGKPLVLTSMRDRKETYIMPSSMGGGRCGICGDDFVPAIGTNGDFDLNDVLALCLWAR
jgi:hypothetical protein